MTEIKSKLSKQNPGGLFITKIVRGRRNKWIEIFNDSELPLELTTLVEENNPLSPITRLDKEVKPGEYLYLSSPGWPGGVPRDKVLLPRKLVLPKRGKLKIWFQEKDDFSDKATFSVVWGDTATTDKLHPNTLPPLTGKAFVRKQNEDGCPRNKKSYSANFSLSNKLPDTGGYSTCPFRRPRDRIEYLKICNTDTKNINPVEDGYIIRDPVGRSGRSSVEQFRIVPHPRSKEIAGTVLMPRELGVIVPPDFESITRRLRYKFGGGKIQLFTLQPVGKEHFRFISEGLVRKRAEQIELIKSDEVPESE